MNPAPRTLLSIQYLRGLAALAVVAHHTGRTHTQVGQAGVDVFFVISGFIMQHVAAREASPAAFLRARALRVVPLYWLMTLLMAAVTLRPWTGADLAQSLLFLPYPGPEGYGWPVLIPGWTLCYEAFFYGLFAISLLLPHRLLVMTVGLLTLAVTGMLLHLQRGTAFAAYTNPLLLEFLAGMWLHRTWQGGAVRHAWPLLFVGLALFLAQVTQTTPIAWRWAVWGVPALLVTAGALSLEQQGRLPAVFGLRQLGDASYSLYLTHTLVLEYLLQPLHPLPAIVGIPAVAGISVAVALVTCHVVERPMTRWLMGGAAERRARAAQADVAVRDRRGVSVLPDLGSAPRSATE